jgi:hypothetical protein
LIKLTVRAVPLVVLGTSHRSLVILFRIWRHYLVGELFEARIAAQRVEHGIDFDVSDDASLFSSVAPLEPIDRLILITEADVDQSVKVSPLSTALLLVLYLPKGQKL